MFIPKEAAPASNCLGYTHHHSEEPVIQLYMLNLKWKINFYTLMDQTPSKTDEKEMQVNSMCLYQTGGLSLQEVTPSLLTNNLLRMTSCVCMLLNFYEYLLNLMASLPFKVFQHCFFWFCSGTEIRRCGNKYIRGTKWTKPLPYYSIENRNSRFSSDDWPLSAMSNIGPIALHTFPCLSILRKQIYLLRSLSHLSKQCYPPAPSLSNTL